MGTWFTSALVRRIARFSVSGVLVTLVHIAAATAWLHWINASSGLANGFAFAVATAFSYCIHTLWSFSAEMEQRVFAKFMVVALVGLGLSAGVGHLVQWLGFSYPYSIAAVVLVMPPYNFLAHHFWTYAKPAAAHSPSQHHPL
nr:GtrA family protein [uncultured Rhodoferax sp.]